ncbi:MAG: SDR family NAD(P)-dependent oxidoreductase [Aestuariivita sp.]|nr:SDR family NAD(P)-dependent oxidoreductase [Aestuariivita sp.]MCY4203593.1 SDR family NAD(P)-dependent oxidoreductase [Aestuariivita sp.]MCY4288929.1 SDR family NAD(P)-dependent oxidoreductase [Aestuariivita sp.]MCY4346170.1 SDR family NAD(P)-dependent oxidoreductase [Aestuariivita sp.]
MRSFRGKRYWLIGASEGLGAALAQSLSARGAQLVISARSQDRLETVAQSLPRAAIVVPIDVTNDASIDSAVAAAGDVDGVVFLAAQYWPMSATEWHHQKAVDMVEVNFVGCLRVLGKVVPRMISRDAGHIVLCGSLAGFRGLPGAIGYGASKAALMSLAETMHADLANTNVIVQLVNPGFIRTRLTEKNAFRMPFIMSPEAAAESVLQHMRGDSFQRSFPRVFSWVFRGSQLMPDWLYFRFFSSREN